MRTIIEMAREAGIRDCTCNGTLGCLERLVELVRADETKRADALAATIAALRDIVTSEAESKADFVERVRNVLGACPDQRVLHAVEAEREACAKVCDELRGINWGPEQCATAIRARSNT